MDEGTSASILSEEPSSSLAATLRLAAAKGYIDKNSGKTKAPVVVTGANKAKLEARSYTIEEKYEKRDRRHDKRLRGHQMYEVKEPKDYKPDIHLEYRDDAGRKLDTREAYRYMCHKFHGKGPGKNKIDKRLKKQQNKFSSTDNPTSAMLMHSKQKELQQPFIILSKGK